MQSVSLVGLSPVRFAVRPATVDDAAAISRVQACSWQTSYRGILPDEILDTMDPERRIPMRRALLREPSTFSLVAYDTTFGDVVGFCNAGPARREGPQVGELYEIYILDRAKRYGLGRELFDSVVEWCEEQAMRSLVIWVLENNHPARRFYEAMGGRPGSRVSSSVRGFPVVEQAYVWDRL